MLGDKLDFAAYNASPWAKQAALAPDSLPGFATPRRAAYLVRRMQGTDLMSEVEQLQKPQDRRAPRPGPPAGDPPGVNAEVSPPRSSKLRPLFELAPYVARYRGRALLALVALTIAALTTLIVPVAVRRMIDFGFTPQAVALINSYFSVMVAVVAVLALASASRYYLVMTIGFYKKSS